MVRVIFYDEVLPLLRSRIFCLMTIFFLVLAYGYYMLNPAVCHDWMNPWSELGWKTVFVTSYMMRWGYGLNAVITAFHGQVCNFVSGLVGLPFWLLGNLFLVGAINHLFKRRSPFYSAVFCALAMTSGLYVFTMAFPNHLMCIGSGTLLSTLAALNFWAYWRNGEKGGLTLATLCFTVAISTYEVFIPYTAFIFVFLLLSDEWNNGHRPFPPLRHSVVVMSLLCTGIVLKAVISFGLMKCNAAFNPEWSLPYYATCGTEVSWFTMGPFAALRQLVIGLFIELCFKPFVSFPHFCAAFSLVVLPGILMRQAFVSRNVWIFVEGIVLVGLCLFFPLLQANMLDQVRKLLPMLPIVLAFEGYLLQWRFDKIRFNCFVLFLLVVYASSLTINFNDICYRYDLDKQLALQILHDVEHDFEVSEEKPLVIVGNASWAAYKNNSPDGVAWLGQRCARVSDLEKRLGWRLLNSGYVGQTTMLDSNRADELYNFLTAIGRRRYPLPQKSQFEHAEELVRKLNVPAYPLAGSILETEDAVVLNLGIRH